MITPATGWIGWREASLEKRGLKWRKLDKCKLRSAVRMDGMRLGDWCVRRRQEIQRGARGDSRDGTWALWVQELSHPTLYSRHLVHRRCLVPGLAMKWHSGTQGLLSRCFLMAVVPSPRAVMGGYDDRDSLFYYPAPMILHRGTFCPLMGHLAISGNISGCHILSGRCYYLATRGQA